MFGIRLFPVSNSAGRPVDPNLILTEVFLAESVQGNLIVCGSGNGVLYGEAKSSTWVLSITSEGELNWIFQEFNARDTAFQIELGHDLVLETFFEEKVRSVEEINVPNLVVQFFELKTRQQGSKTYQISPPPPLMFYSPSAPAISMHILIVSMGFAFIQV